MSWRLKKQLIYGFIFLLIFSIFIGGLIYVFKPAASCYDNKKNQGEEGIDCGGPCLPCEITNLNLIIEKPKIIIYPDNTLDLIGKVKNPSDKYGLRNFEYKFILYGEGIKAEVSGKSSIMPLETKYLIIVNRKVPNFEIKSSELKINFDKKDWVETERKEIQVKLLNYLVEQDQFKAEIVNNDNQPYYNLEINFLLLDIFENIIGVLKTSIDYLEPLERKNIILTLPPISQEINQVIIIPNYNFFEDNEN